MAVDRKALNEPLGVLGLKSFSRTRKKYSRATRAAYLSRLRHDPTKESLRWGDLVEDLQAKLEGKTEVVYVLDWPDEATKTAAWTAFMADKEWSDIKRVTSAEHGVLVGGIEDRILTPLDYSPASGRSLLTS